MEQENEQRISVPYVAYESAAWRADRKNKRLCIILVSLMLLIIGKGLCTEVLFLKQQSR